MAFRKILTEGNETLRKKSRPVTKFDGRLHTLLDDMKETLQEAGGVGLGQRRRSAFCGDCLWWIQEKRSLSVSIQKLWNGPGSR